MITTQTYLRDRQALAFYREKASPEFWDRHWKIDDLRQYIRAHTDDRLFIPAVKRHLPAGSRILEGGCGRGQLVHALQIQGFQAIGVDFAPATIRLVKAAAPELHVYLGDVRSLPLPDRCLDGYLSAGVIEHFWEGHQGILSEMRRTLRIGGFVFLSFPYLSPLRRLKARLRLYPVQDSHLLDDQQDQFYQFALDVGNILADLEAQGFHLREQFRFDGIKGFKDEMRTFRPWLQQIYDGKGGYRLRRAMDTLLKPFASHCALLVMERVE